MDRGARWAAVRGIAKSRTRLSDCVHTAHGTAVRGKLRAETSYSLVPDKNPALLIRLAVALHCGRRHLPLGSEHTGTFVSR